MIELRILTGRMAGQTVLARHFPFTVGRSQECDLCLPDPGIWEKHFIIRLDSANRVLLQAGSTGGIYVNGEQTTSVPMHSGDVVRVGDADISCACAPMRQYDQKWREIALWVGGALLILVEFIVFSLLYH